MDGGSEGKWFSEERINAKKKKMQQPINVKLSHFRNKYLLQ